MTRASSRFPFRFPGWILTIIGNKLRTRVRFDFEPQKLVAATTLFASKKLPELTTLKVSKLLYFADKRHLLRYGRPILGDAYFGMKDGPVPSTAYNVLKGATGQTSDLNWKKIEPLFRRFLDVVTPDGKKYGEFRAIRSPDLDELSKSDVEILEEVVSTLGQKSASQLRALAHREPDFGGVEKEINAGRKSVPMPYESFFDGQVDSALKIKSLMLAEQEDRDFFARL